MGKVLKQARTRRTHSEEFKQIVVAACSAPGASVAGIALAHGINANLAHRWMAERGITPARQRAMLCAPQPEQLPEPGATFIPVGIQAEHSGPLNIQIQIRRGNTSVSVSWPLEGAAACAAWLGAWLR